MKNNFLSMAIIATGMFALSQTVTAQQSMLIGVEGTPQMSWLYNEDDRDNKAYKEVNTLNGSFGVSWQFNFTNMLGIGVNGLYSYQGQRYELNGVERVKKIEYVKIPVMFVYTSDINSDIMFIGKIGPQLGLITQARFTDKEGDDIIIDHKSAYEDFDISGVISAGIGFKLGENFILDASLRGDCGFTDAEDKDYKLNINNPTVAVNGNGSESTISNRAMTSNATAGVTVGIRYLIKYE